MRATFVCLKKDLTELAPKAFKVAEAGKWLRGLVVQKRGRYFAYLNECKHLPMALDFGGGSLLNDTGKMLQCNSHGALYLIESGLCTEGPCVGQSLIPLEIQDEGDSLVIFFPERVDQPGGAKK